MKKLAAFFRQEAKPITLKPVQYKRKWRAPVTQPMVSLTKQNRAGTMPELPSWATNKPGASLKQVAQAEVEAMFKSGRAPVIINEDGARMRFAVAQAAAPGVKLADWRRAWNQAFGEAYKRYGHALER